MTDGVLAELRATVGRSAVSTEPVVRERAAGDFFWLSPVLERDLPRTLPDVVVTPESTADVARVLAVAYAHRIAVVARGAGTGNYGQAVPFARGIVLDMSACARVLEVGEDWVAVEAGITFAALDRALAEVGRQPVVMPSMAGSTVGGFLSGGNQGIGSIAHGSIWDGWVRRLSVASCVSMPSITEVRGRSMDGHLHGFGTAGVLTEVSMSTEPRLAYVAVYGAFDSLRAAAEAGLELMSDRPAPRAVTLDDERVYRTFPEFSGNRGRVLLRASVAAERRETAVAVLTDHGGVVTAVDDGVGRIYTTAYNHAMLRAKQADIGACALQIRGAAVIEHERQVRDCLPDARLHLDGNAPAAHGLGYSGLLISRWVDDGTLRRGMDRLAELGVIVISPHTWRTGSHGRRTELLRAARTFDPGGLLNPGKLERGPTEGVGVAG